MIDRQLRVATGLAFVLLALSIALARALVVRRGPAPTPAPPLAIVQEDERFVRCLCPECRRLDLAHPTEGYQLALFPYRASVIGERR